MENTTEPTKEITLGEKRCHINFNPSSDDKIGQFKRMMADAIDFCAEEIRISECNDFAEQCRCFEIAMENLETAQMYAVKGIAKGLK
jgi:hypothetical protein